MNKQRHYSRAPIKEAVIDIRVELPESITLETLASIRGSEKDTYPKVKSRFQVEIKGESGRSLAVSTRQTELGYQLWSEDERQSFQAGLDGFTFSRLAPYDNWSTFRNEARRIWTIYRRIAQPIRITRVAVRYINLLELPLPFDDFKDYLRTVPEVSPDLPQALSGYFMQVQIPFHDLLALLILNEAILPEDEANIDKIPMILDIDLFREVDIPYEEKALWVLFEQLHVRKNAAFEACITDRMRELIA